MAKKDEFGTDDFDFDNDLDFNFDGMGVDDTKPPKKGDRSPISDVARGTWSGATETITNPEFFRKILRKTLPKEYGEMENFASGTLGSVRDLYNSSAKELKPAINQLKKTTKSMMPGLRDKLPKKIGNFLDDWSKDEGGGRASEDYRESGIQMQLDFFKAQAEDQLQKDKETSIKEAAQNAMEQARHKDQLGQLDAIRIATQRQVDYQDRITVQYQRKSLELQYRHHFVAVDTLEEIKKLGTVITENLESITRNTALPEVQKIKASERFKDTIRNRFIDGAADSMHDLRRRFTKDMVGNIKNAVLTRVRDFNDQFVQGLEMAEQFREQQQQMAEMGIEMPSGAELGGNIIGSELMNSAGGKFANWFSKKFASSKYYDPTKKQGLKGVDFIRTLPQQFKAWKGKSEFDEKTTFLEKNLDKLPNFVQSFIRDIIPNMNPDMRVESDNVKSLQMPTPFTNAARKSITEVIPGFLARIYQELQIIRTGNDSIELTSYDYASNKFTGSSAVKDAVFNQVIDRSGVRYAKADALRMVDSIDKEKTLSRRERHALADKLLMDNNNNVTPDPARYANADTFSQNKHLSKNSEAIANLFRDHFQIDSTGAVPDTLDAWSKKSDFNRSFERLGAYISNPVETVQALINAGYYEELRQLGIIDKNSKINESKLKEYQRGNRYKKTPGQKASFNTTGSLGPVMSTVPMTAPVASMQAPERGYSPSPSTSQKAEYGSDSKLDLINESILKGGETASSIDKRIMRVIELLENGITVAGFSDKPVEGSGKKKLMSYTMGDMLSGVINGGWEGIKGITQRTLGVANWGSKKTSQLFSIGKRWGGATKDWLFKKGGDLKEDFDIWLKDKAEPAILAWKLKAGLYKEKATGKVITSIEELKKAMVDSNNAIVDEEGNVVLTFDDLKSRLDWSKVSAGLKSRAEKFGTWAKDLATKTFNRSSKMLGGVYDYVWSGSQKLYDFAKSKFAEDVYVKTDMSTPRLLGVVMGAGGYTRVLTKDRLNFATDINGPISENTTGRILITEEDIKTGLVNAKGEPFKTYFRAGLDKLKATKDRVFGALKRGWDTLSGMASDAWKSVKNFFGNAGLTIVAGSDLAKILREIYELLDERMPGKKKKVVGDADGDGARDGSWQSNAKKAGKTIKEKGTQGIELLGTKLDELTKAIKKNIHGSEDGEETMLDKAADWLGMADDLNDLRGGKRPRFEKTRGRFRRMKDGLRKPGLFGRMKNGAGGLMRRIPGGGWVLDKAGGAIGRVSESGIGQRMGGWLGGMKDRLAGLGKSGLEAAGKIPGAGVASRTGSILGTLGKGLGYLGTGAGKALGGIGRGIGYAGRNIPLVGSLIGAGMLANTWTDDKLSQRAKVADTGGVLGGMAGGAAAGAAIGSVFGGIGAIPGALIGGILGSMGGTKLGGAAYDLYKDITQKNDKVEANTLKSLRMAQYGFTESETDKLAKISWLEARIMPSVIFNDNGAVIDASKIRSADFLSDFNVNPGNKDDVARFGDWFVHRFVPVFRTHLTALRAIDKKAKLEAVDTLTAEQKVRFLSAVNVSPAFTGVMTSPFGGRLTASQDLVSQVYKNLKEKIDTDAKKAGGAAAAVVAGTAAVTSTKPEKSEKKDDVPNLDDAQKAAIDIGNELMEVAGNGSSVNPTRTSVQGQLISANEGYGRRHDELDFIRFKSYGLTSLEKEKIRSIAHLEKAVSKDLSFDAKGAGAWNGSLVTVGMAVGPYFGFSSIDSADGNNFTLWFRSRFLPIYLAYMGMLKQLTNKTEQMSAANTLKNEEKIKVAKAITTLTTSYNGSTMSTWKVDISPWPGYKVNTNADSVKTNMESLVNGSKPATYVEQQSAKSTTPTASQAAPAANDPAYNQKVAQLPGDRVRQQSGYPTQSQINADATPANASGKGVNTNIQGEGGTLGQLPDVEQPGSYSGVSKLLKAVAKMVGVDEDLLAVMAAIESGFNPNAAAKTSSAKGLFQFINDTWNGMLKKHGSKYGIPEGTSVFDPKANALMGAQYIKDNVAFLKSKIGRDPTQTDLYLAHFMGAGGAAKFLSADQNAVAATLFPDAAAANSSIFYDKRTGQARTVGEIYNLFTALISKKAQSFGLSSSSDSMPVSTKAAKTTTPQAAPAAMSPIPAPTTGVNVEDAGGGGYAGSARSAATQAPSSPPRIPQPAINVAGGYDTTPRMMQEQSKAKGEDYSRSVGEISNTLIESLNVQKQSLEVLTSIYGLIKKQSVEKTAANDSKAPEPEVRQVKVPQTVNGVPVPMSRK